MTISCLDLGGAWLAAKPPTKPLYPENEKLLSFRACLAADRRIEGLSEAISPEVI